MPLKVMDEVELRLRVVLEVSAGCSPREVAARYGIGKTQVYEWVRRYAESGAEGLVPRSRRPLVSPGQLSPAVEDMIVQWRKDRPRWGAKKIRSMLARDGCVPLPAVSTVHQVLIRRGLVEHTPRRREPPGGWRRFVRAHSNDLWHVDATRHCLANGRGFWVIDLVDDHSRFLLTTLVCPSPTASAGWNAVRSAVATYGLPRQIISDNGLNFTGRLRGITVAFERQVRAAGIELIHSRPYHPETLGKLERQHATQNHWIIDHRRPRQLREAQQLLDAYRHDYNTARPHEGIGQAFPVEIYRPDDGLELPTIELAPADAFPDGCLFRKVNTSGQISYGGRRWPLDTRWNGITLGLKRVRGRLDVYYGAALIDTIGVGSHPAPQPRGRQPKQ